MKSAVTVSLVEEASGGPFVFWHDLEHACRTAHELGFDAIELFAPGPDAVPAGRIQELLYTYKLKLAAVGTGAGWVKHKLSLTAADQAQRQAAINFITQMMHYGSNFGAPAIIGSMQGTSSPEVPRELALRYLGEALTSLDQTATKIGVKLIYEPLNRYETKLLNRQQQAAEFLKELGTKSVVLLADLFHMNIEEQDLSAAIIAAGSYIGHIHFVDSNRQAAGFGHINFTPIMQALKKNNYQGYLSAEALPSPDSITAATQTMKAFRELVDFKS